jgi:hypothetical protein
MRGQSRIELKKLRRMSEHAAPEGAAVSSYRCYFLDETNHIAGGHFVQCGTDDPATTARR